MTGLVLGKMAELLWLFMLSVGLDKMLPRVDGLNLVIFAFSPDNDM